MNEYMKEKKEGIHQFRLSKKQEEEAKNIKSYNVEKGANKQIVKCER